MSEKEPFLPIPGSEGTSESLETRVEWLKQHASPIESIDPNHEDFRDLHGFGEAIGDARVVMLGEATHYDGATFHAKTRLVKYLHEEKGFDVLAFESGLYDCRRAWNKFQQGENSAEAFRSGVFNIWSGSEEIQPLARYLGEQANTDHPLELTGFDMQFSARKTSDPLVADLRTLREKLGNAAPDVDQYTDIEQAFVGLDNRNMKRTKHISVEMLEQWRGATIVLQSILEKTEPSSKLPASELAFWRRVAGNAAVVAEDYIIDQQGGDEIEKSRKTWELRDSRMADNLIWLARDVYPGKKIIAWSASSHVRRNLPEAKAMGDYVYEKLGDQIYTAAFISAQGQYHSFRRKGESGQPEPIDPPEPGSLEDLFVRTGHANAFIDFRHLQPDGAWLKEKMKARPVAHQFWERKWPDVYDGMVFIKDMYGTTPSKT